MQPCLGMDRDLDGQTGVLDRCFLLPERAAINWCWTKVSGEVSDHAWFRYNVALARDRI